MPRPVTVDEIYDVAEQAVDIFRSHDLHTCLFGSAACSLYGVDRTPNVSSGFPHGVRDLLAELLRVLMRLMQDIGLVVLTKNYDQEELKQLLVDGSDDFYLVPSRNPSATYSVLWCRLSGGSNRRSRFGGRGSSRRSCKVDILVPGVLNIPNVPQRRIKMISELPVMPLIPLLLLKLQGWSNHRESTREDMQEKQYVDAEDVVELLQIAVERDQRVWQGNLS